MNLSEHDRPRASSLPTSERASARDRPYILDESIRRLGGSSRSEELARISEDQRLKAVAFGSISVFSIPKSIRQSRINAAKHAGAPRRAAQLRDVALLCVLCVSALCSLWRNLVSVISPLLASVPQWLNSTSVPTDREQARFLRSERASVKDRPYSTSGRHGGRPSVRTFGSFADFARYLLK
jgi:hypothetical protein